MELEIKHLNDLLNGALNEKEILEIRIEKAIDLLESRKEYEGECEAGFYDFLIKILKEYE